MAVEEPPFQTIVQDGAFEIRNYPALVVAEVTVNGQQSEAGNKGFRILATYIFGGNHKKQSIAMTAPVTEERSGETIAMTAPVNQTRMAEEWVVRFTMPGGSSLETLPEPDDSRVRLREAPPSRVAVIRFSGLARQNDVAARTVELESWLRGRKLQPGGASSLAQYNPPWTLWFLRRNEVMIPLIP